NTSGQLGQDSTTAAGNGSGTSMASLAAINLGAGRTAVKLAVGYTSACAVLDNGTAKCWGAGTSGALGQGTTATWGSGANLMANLPAISLSSTNSPTYITAGQNIGCVKLNDASGSVKCWGMNTSGQ